MVENIEDDQKYQPPAPRAQPPFNRVVDISQNLPKSRVSDKIISLTESETKTVVVSCNFSELDETLNSMIEKSENRLAIHGQRRADVCKVCGKEGKHIKDHIEANHLEGIQIPCNHCDAIFRSRNALRKHKIRQYIYIMD